jgi:hypothetical protein
MATGKPLVRLPQYTDGLRRNCRMLLTRGANPNQNWINPAFPDCPLSAL